LVHNDQEVDLSAVCQKWTGVFLVHNDQDAPLATLEESGTCTTYCTICDTYQDTMSSPSSCDLVYTQFNQRLNTLRYQHAVVFCGQNLLHLVLRTLICGDINNINGCVKKALKSNTQYKNSFTKDETPLLEKENHKTWDITLLFKVIQKVCGLEPAGNSCWKPQNGGSGEEKLECHITSLKELRNGLVHEFDLVITVDQLKDNLDKLTDLALKMITCLGECALAQGKQISEEESNRTMQVVWDIIEDVKEKINAPSLKSPKGTVPESDEGNNDSDEDQYESDRLQFDNVYVAAGAGGQGPLELSLQEELTELENQFWKYAGPKNAVV
ncbi:unnamed protein product, partial [Meganyctiphanes norvegica]